VQPDVVSDLVADSSLSIVCTFSDTAQPEKVRPVSALQAASTCRFADSALSDLPPSFASVAALPTTLECLPSLGGIGAVLGRTWPFQGFFHAP
jgi:hypothetical protein